MHRFPAVLLMLTAALAFLCGPSLAENRITVRGMYVPGSLMHLEASTNNFAGTYIGGRDSGDASIDGGFGIACEIEAFKIFLGNVDVIAGGSYGLARRVSHLKGELDVDPPVGPIPYSEDVDDAQFAMYSVFTKARYMLPLSWGKANAYASVKFAYSIPSTSGKDAEYLSLDNCYGYGISVGAIIDDRWDVELGADTIGATMNEDLTFYYAPSWYSDTVHGKYSSLLTTFSLGYRL